MGTKFANRVENIAMNVLSGVVEGSYFVTDLLDGTVAEKCKINKKNTVKKSSKTEDDYGEELDDGDHHLRTFSTGECELSILDKLLFANTEHDFREIINDEETGIQVISKPDDEVQKIIFTVQEELDDEKPINNSQLDNIIKNYNYRDKLFATSILYSCHKVTADQLGALVSAIDGDSEVVKGNIEYINSITKYFTGYDFAPNPEYKDKAFDLADGQLQVFREVIGLDILANNPMISPIIEKVRIWARENNKVVIIFDNSKLDLFQSDAPKSMIAAIEGAYGDILKDYKHKISKLPTGMAEISIMRDTGSVDVYTVDPGLVIGQGVKVLVKAMNGGDLFTSNHVILTKSFINKAYVMSDEEYKKVLLTENQFINQNLYLYYDFSNSSKIFKDIEREDINSLENKLIMIYDVLFRIFGKTCRLRLKNFKSNDAFIVVSDDKCKIPMSEMIQVIIDGLVVKVKDNEIVVNLNDANGNNIYNNTIVLDDIEKQLIEEFSVPVDVVLDQKSAIPIA